MLKGKKIIVGVSGSIAAYKSTYLVREFVKAGAEVKVVLTPMALDFVTPLTLATLSKHPVVSDLIADREEGTWTNHVDLGLWADLMVIAPATANTMAKMAQSTADNLLLTTYLSAKCPVYIAPAMDLDMYQHPAVQANMQQLEGYGNTIIRSTHGELASGLVGEGRMAEPEDIRAFIEKHLQEQAPLHGKQLLVTAGPTYEDLDPVRFLGNRSTGRMGFAIAAAAASLGATVTLVAGPTHQNIAHPSVQRIDVRSAAQMAEACKQHFPQADITIMSAAVADYRPATVSSTKIKKKEDDFHLPLERTEDILAALGKQKQPEQLLVGFALETDNELENAKGKLKRKNLDLIVLNSLQDKGAGFAHNTNKITLIDANNNLISFELKSKSEVAEDLLQHLCQMIQK